MKYNNKRYRTGRGIISTPIFLIMKLTICIFFLSIFGAMGSVTAQRVSIDVKAVSLQKVLIDIGKQSKHILIYEDKDMEGTNSITQQFMAKELTEALDIVLKGQPIRYMIKGKTIVLSRIPKMESAPSQVTKPLLPEQQPIRGRVTNEKGEPLAGASVYVLDAQGRRTAVHTNYDLV